MSRTKILALVLGLAVSGLLLVQLLGGTANGGSKQAAEPDPLTRPPRSSPSVAEPRGDPPTQGEAGDHGPRSSASQPERDKRRELLQRRFGRAASTSEGAGTPDEPSLPLLPPESWTSLPEKYVGGIIRDQLIPVARSCYGDLAEPGLHGTVAFKVGVIGDQEIGGIVDSIEVDREQTTLDGDLFECVRLAASELEFEPPGEGQSLVEFEFSLEFSDDEAG